MQWRAAVVAAVCYTNVPIIQQRTCSSQWYVAWAVHRRHPADQMAVVVAVLAAGGAGVGVGGSVVGGAGAMS